MDPLVGVLCRALHVPLSSASARRFGSEPETGLPGDMAWVIVGPRWEVWIYDDEVDVRPSAASTQAVSFERLANQATLVSQVAAAVREI